MSNEKEQEKQSGLTPIEEKTVNFYGDEITAALIQIEPNTDAEVYVPLRPICEYLGLSWRGQRERIERDEVLREALQGVRVTRTPLDSSKRSAGGPQESMSLPLKFLPGWLFGVDTNRVKSELREKIIRYRRECYDVLWKAFKDEAMLLTDENASLFDVPTPDYPSKEPNPELVRIREMGLAIAHLAQQQIELEHRQSQLEQRQTSNDTRLDQAARVFGNLQKRVSRIEELVQPADRLSDQQAATIGQTVKMLATQLTKKGATGSQYQAVFNELYRLFGVADYKSLRRDQYQQALDFLEDWRQAAGGQPQPQQKSMGLEE